MITYTPNLPCSCGGVLQQMTWNQHLIFNVVFTLLALFAIWLTRKKGNINEAENKIPKTVFT